MDLLQKYSRDGWANELGIQVASLDAGQCSLILPFVTRNLQTDGGVVHGGIIASLLHDSGFLVAAQALDVSASEYVRCLDFQVNYLKAAKDCELTCGASVLRLGRKFAFIQAEALNPEKECVALSRMLFSISDESAVAKPLQVYSGREKLDLPVANDHPMVSMMNDSMQARRPGISIEGSEGGLCRIDVEDLPENRNFYGEIANGTQIFAADSAGVFSSFASGEILSRAATVDLKLTFCAAVKNEGVTVIGESLILNNGLVHHQLSIFGKQSKELKGFGTMTLAV